MTKRKKIIAVFASLAAIIICSSSVNAAENNSVNVTIDVSKDRKAVSPYIYTGWIVGRWQRQVLSYSA